MKSLLIRARQYKPLASAAEQGALDYFLEHSDCVPSLSIKQLSELCYTSPSTIVRLCRKLGFDGFRDVQQTLVYELAVHERARSRSDSNPASVYLSEIMESITYHNIVSLEESLQMVDPQALDLAADHIVHARSVLLFGLGASLLVAKDAFLKFIRINKPCTCCEDIHSQYVTAKNATSEDVAILISYSGCTEEIVRCAEFLKAQGTPIIAITRAKPSPISRLATVSLNVVASEPLIRNSAMSSRISQLNMVDILYTACVNRNLNKNREQITHNRIQKQ